MSSLVNKSYTNKYKSKLGNESSMTEAILAAAKKTNMCIRFEEKAAIVSNTLIVDVHDILSSSNTRDLEEKLDIANAFLNSIFTFVKNADNLKVGTNIFISRFDNLRVPLNLELNNCFNSSSWIGNVCSRNMMSW